MLHNFSSNTNKRHSWCQLPTYRDPWTRIRQPWTPSKHTLLALKRTPIRQPYTPSKHALLAMERAYGKNWRKIDWAMVEACKDVLNPGITALYFYDNNLDESPQYHTYVRLSSSAA